MAFWIAAAGIALAVTALLVTALLRGRSGAEPAAAYDLRVYRDQLREIERDTRARRDPRCRGRAAAHRGLAPRAGGGPGGGEPPGAAADAPRSVTLAMAGLVAAAMLGGVWAYLRLGAPGYPDMPMARAHRDGGDAASRPPEARPRRKRRRRSPRRRPGGCRISWT